MREGKELLYQRLLSRRTCISEPVCESTASHPGSLTGEMSQLEEGGVSERPLRRRERSRFGEHLGLGLATAGA